MGGVRVLTIAVGVFALFLPAITLGALVLLFGIYILWLKV
jgi:uncharacterized membrane protein HdeD (DUF308 family)